MNYPISTDRRDFLLAGTAAVAALSTGPVAAHRPDESLDIIDCHTHFYDPARPQGVPWPAEGTSLYRSVLPRDLHALPKVRPVTGTVIVEAGKWVEDNQWLLDLAREDPFIVGIVGNLTPGEVGFEDHLKRFAMNELFRGIRINYQQLDPLLQGNHLDDLKRLADHDLELDVNGRLINTESIPKLAAKIPQLRIVINHVGNVRIDANRPDPTWVDRINAAAQYENVYCKISALVEGASQAQRSVPSDLEFYRPYIDTVWDAFGDDRVIYGSNWPVSERAADYATLQKIVLDYAGEKGVQATKNFCSFNAKRAYKWIEREGRRKV